MNKGIHVYEPQSFRQFCITAGATKLFDTVLSAITSARHSSERIILNKKRVVSFIYNTCYCLSQACNLETEHIMGLSCARRTVNSVVNTMAKNHYQSFQNFIKDAVKNKWLLVSIIDDYTSVHTKRRRQGEKASEAKSMYTIVVKAFKQIQAINVEEANFTHNVNGISIASCQDIITSA